MIVIALCIASLLWHSTSIPAIESLGARIRDIKQSMSVWRLGAIGLLMIAWPTLIARNLDPTDPRVDLLLTLRWRLAAGGIAMELALGRGLPFSH